MPTTKFSSSSNDVVDSLMKKCLENDFSGPVRREISDSFSSVNNNTRSTVFHRTYTVPNRPQSARREFTGQKAVNNSVAGRRPMSAPTKKKVDNNAVDVLDELIDSLYLTSSRVPDSVKYAESSNKSPDKSHSNSADRKTKKTITDLHKHISGNMTNRQRPHSARPQSSPKIAAPRKIHSARVRRNSSINAEINENSSRRASFITRTVWDLLKLGSMKRQEHIESMMRDGKILSVEYLERDSTINRLHSYIQQIVQIKKPTQHIDMKRLISEAYKKKDKDEEADLRKQQEALTGIFRHRREITRHQYKALIRNIHPQKFQEDVKKKKQFQEPTEEFIGDEVVKHIKEQVKQDESLKTQRQKLLDITKSVTSYDESLDSKEVELFEDLEGFDELVDRERFFSGMESQTNRVESGHVSPIPSPSSDNRSTTLKSQQKKSVDQTYNHLMDKSVPSFVTAWYHKNKQSGESETPREAENSSKSVYLLARTVTETKLKLFEPYSPKRFKQPATTQQELPVQRWPSPRKQPLKKPNSKAQSLVIAFQEMVLPRETAEQHPSAYNTKSSNRSSTMDLNNQNPFEFIHKASVELIQTPALTDSHSSKKPLKKQNTTNTYRKRPKLKPPLDTGSTVYKKRRNKLVDVGLVPPQSVMLSTVQSM
jgi:hypothetical protein